jgi:hypothetical protein
VIDVLCTASAPLNFHHLSTLCSAPQVHQSGTQIQSESLRLAPPQLCPTSYLVELLPCTASPYTCHLHLHLPPTPTTHAYTHTYHPRLHPHLPPTPTPTPTTHDYTHTYHLHLHLHRASLRSCVLTNTGSPGPGVQEADGMGVRGFTCSSTSSTSGFTPGLSVPTLRSDVAIEHQTRKAWCQEAVGVLASQPALFVCPTHWTGSPSSCSRSTDFQSTTTAYKRWVTPSP